MTSTSHRTRQTSITAGVVALAVMASACAGGDETTSGPVEGVEPTESQPVQESAPEQESQPVEVSASETSESTDVEVAATDPVATEAPGSDTTPEGAAEAGIGRLAGQPLESCRSLDVDLIATVVDEPVVVTDDAPPVSPYRMCSIYAEANRNAQLGQLIFGPDLDGEKYQLVFADADALEPLPELGDDAGHTQGLFTFVRARNDGAEVIFEARKMGTGLNWPEADVSKMASVLPDLVADMTPSDELRALPDGIAGCDDLPFDSLLEETIGEWMTASYESMLQCVADTSGGNRVSIVVGDRGSTDEALDFVNARVDDNLEAANSDFSYPIAQRSDSIDKGYSAFDLRVLTDYGDILEGDDVKGVSAIASRGRFVAWFSVIGPIGDEIDGVQLYTGDTAAILGDVLDGVESDYDADVREEDLDAAADAFFAGEVPSLESFVDGFGECEGIDVDAIGEAISRAPISLDDEGGFVDDDGNQQYCNFYDVVDGDLDIGIFVKNPVDIEVWNGQGEVPWAEWQIEDTDQIFASGGAVVSYNGPDRDMSLVIYTDESGAEVLIELDNRRLNPVTFAESLEVLRIAVDGLN